MTSNYIVVAVAGPGREDFKEELLKLCNERTWLMEEPVEDERSWSVAIRLDLRLEKDQ